jgi:AraC family transcriptional regulator
MSALIPPSELPKWVPGQILCASDDLGWRDVALRSYRYRGQDVDVPAMRDFIVVSYRRGATPMNRKFDGAWTRTHCEPGDVSLLTRSQRSHWHWTDDIDVSHVYLSESLVANVANEILGRSVAEVRLHDVLKVRDPVLSHAVEAIALEAQQRALGGALYIDALGTQIAVHLLRRYASVSFREADDKSGLTPQQDRRLADYVEAHLGEPLALETLAAVVQLGVWTFSRRFRAGHGQAPHAWVITRRIERARRLLERGALPVKEVASLCGFADQAHMTRVFRARLHTTPAALRQGHAGG